MTTFIRPLPHRLLLPDKALTDRMPILAVAHPLADAHLAGRVSDTPPSTADDEIAGPVRLVSEHALDGAAVDGRVGGDVSCLAFGQRPADRLPGAVLAQVHAAEGEIFHNIPAYCAEGGGAVLELEDVVHAALGGGVVQFAVEGVVTGGSVVRGDVVVVDKVAHCVARAAAAVCGGVVRSGRAGGEGHGGDDCVAARSAICSVFVAAVESCKLVFVELEACPLCFSDHPHEGNVAQSGFVAFVKRPASSDILRCISWCRQGHLDTLTAWQPGNQTSEISCSPSSSSHESNVWIGSVDSTLTLLQFEKFGLKLRTPEVS